MALHSAFGSLCLPHPLLPLEFRFGPPPCPGIIRSGLYLSRAFCSLQVVLTEVANWGCILEHLVRQLPDCQLQLHSLVCR